jgi:hypothetical protein
VSSFVTRLHAALDDRRQPGDSVRVSKSDLRELLHHFERLDHEARIRHAQQGAAPPMTLRERLAQNTIARKCPACGALSPVFVSAPPSPDEKLSEDE